MSIRVVMPGMLYYVFLSAGSDAETAQPLVRHVWELEPNLVPEFPTDRVNAENFLHGIPSVGVHTILRTDQRTSPADAIFCWQATQYQDVITCTLTDAPNNDADTSERWLKIWNSQQQVLGDADLAQARQVGEGLLGDAIVFFGQIDSHDFVQESLAAANLLLKSLVGDDIDLIGREQLNVSSPGIAIARIFNAQRRQILLVLVSSRVPDAEDRLLSPLILNGYGTRPPALVAYLNASVKVLYESAVRRQRHETLATLVRELNAERFQPVTDENRRKIEHLVHRRNDLFAGYRRLRLTVEAASANMQLFRLPTEHRKAPATDPRPPWEIGTTLFAEDEQAANQLVKQIDADFQRLESMSSVFDEWHAAESRERDERIEADARHSELQHAFTERLLALIGVAFTGTSIVDSILGDDARKPAYMFCVTVPLLLLAYFGVQRIQWIGRKEVTLHCLRDELIVAGCVGYLAFLLWPAAWALKPTLEWAPGAFLSVGVVIAIVVAWQFASGRWAGKKG